MVDVSIATDRGPRERLEDRAAALALRLASPFSATVAVIADGVGGIPGGDKAARTAQDAALHHACGALLAQSPLEPGPATLAAIAASSLEAANEAVRHTQADGEYPDMATTGLVAVLAGDHLALAWAGDSGCILITDDRPRTLTRPHTRARELIGLGLLGPDEAAHHPASRTLAQWIGKPDPQVETTTALLRGGDSLVLYTDGLLEGLDPERIAAMAAEPPFDGLARRLVNAALAAGSRDNVTCLCLRPTTRPADLTQSYLHAVGQLMEIIR